MKNIEENINELNTQIDSSQIEAQKIKKEINELQNKISTLEKQLDSMPASSESDEKQIKKLKHEILLTQHAINNRNKNLSKLANAPKVLESNKSKRSKVLATRSSNKPGAPGIEINNTTELETNISTKQTNAPSTSETTSRISVIDSYIERAIMQLNNNSN